MIYVREYSYNRNYNERALAYASLSKTVFNKRTVQETMTSTSVTAVSWTRDCEWPWAISSTLFGSSFFF